MTQEALTQMTQMMQRGDADAQWLFDLHRSSQPDSPAADEKGTGIISTQILPI